MQTKRKRMIVFPVVIALLFGCIVLMQCEWAGRDGGRREATIEGIILEIREESLLFQDDVGGVYRVTFAADGIGEEIKSLSVGDAIKIWFSGEIAETDPMQITACKIKKILR